MKRPIGEIKQIVANLKSDRSNWESLWQDIGDYIFTRKNTILVKRTEGEDRQVFLYDNTGPHSHELLAGILMSILMSIEEMWFEYSTGDLELDSKDNVREALQRLSRKMHDLLANTNFYNEAHEMCLDTTGFGTSIFGIEEDELDIVRFHTKFLGEGYIAEDARGKVDEVYLEYEFNAVQLIKEYGDKNLPKDVKKALENNDQKKFKVIHAIYPFDHQRKKKSKKGFVYISQHIMPELEHELKEGGYESFPYAVPRFSKAAGETYGRCPAMTALPEVKVLNRMVETTLIGAEKAIDPPLQAPDDGFITQLNTFPAGISYYRSGSQDRIEPIFNDSRIDFGFEMISEKQSKIRDAFYINQLILPQKNGNPATATEIAERSSQAMRFMGPFLARMQKEFLQPVVDRVTAIAFEKGYFKPEDIPQELRGKKFSIKFTSFIARAQRQGMLQNIMRFFQAAEPFVALNPNIGMMINGDDGLRAVAQLLGVPHELLHSREETDKMIQQKQQAEAEIMQSQQQMQEMESVAKVSKAVK